MLQINANEKQTCEIGAAKERARERDKNNLKPFYKYFILQQKGYAATTATVAAVELNAFAKLESDFLIFFSLPLSPQNATIFNTAATIMNAYKFSASGDKSCVQSSDDIYITIIQR